MYQVGTPLGQLLGRAMKKVQGSGYQTYPAAPAAGTAVAQSASANTYGAWVQMVASTAAAIYIVGVSLDDQTNAIPTYIMIDLGTGAGGAEVSLGVAARFSGTGGAATNNPPMEYTFPYPIAVPVGTRIAARTASAEATANSLGVTVKYVAQSNLVTF